MHKHVLLAAVVCFAGVVASFFVLPNAQDYQRAEAVDLESIDSGKVNLEAEYAQGRRSFAIVNGLAEKKTAEEDPAAALALWEEYASVNKTDLRGHVKLAEHYKLAGRKEAYTKQLQLIEELTKAQPAAAGAASPASTGQKL